MKFENMTILKAKESKYYEMVSNADNAMYCEITYKRDKSSFAGIFFTFSKNNCFKVFQQEERLVQIIDEHEKIYLGSDKDYIEAIKGIYEKGEKGYGLAVLSLVYSSTKSSEIVFEKLMEKLDEHLDELRISKIE